MKDKWKISIVEELMSRFGGIDKVEYMLDKFPAMDIELNNLKQREEQLQLQQESPGPGSLQASPPSSHCTGTMPEFQYSDVDVDQLIQSLADDNVLSKSDDLDSFDNLLDGDREIVGKYKIPTPLVSTAQNIFNVHIDITRKSKYSVHAVQTIFVLFCAAIKEMSNRSLELVTEEILWKLRDPIMDAKRSEFDRNLRTSKLGNSLSAFRHSVLSQLPRQNQPDGRLNLPRRDCRLLVVTSEPGSFISKLLENVVDETIHNPHGLTRNPHIRVNLLQNLEDIDLVGFHALLGSLLLLSPPSLGSFFSALSFFSAGFFSAGFFSAFGSIGNLISEN
ncbi:hypothetical protein F3Y22_tig00110956pilonHSYRG00055 [Hibiscus syriacus]|uniref:Uncharacterized protein n=1 Tax=Hibiscus syriacus TaxID=106335 RepID=A0A6A2ZB53_HIBSY|nr:hypothetical protein F3Y22_tig00110956pilonHSYRG00055 [Hibiscus syriacus]